MDLRDHPEFRRLVIPPAEQRIASYIARGIVQAAAVGDHATAQDWADALIVEDALAEQYAQAALN